MTNKIIVVTEPDDIPIQGFRICVIDPTQDQSQLISDTLKTLESNYDLICYFWKYGDPIEWLVDKIYKSRIIIFNAESSNQTLIGYVASYNNSFYFGNLLSLHKVNTRQILSSQDLYNILKEEITKSEER